MSLKKFREFLDESEEERTYSFEELSPEAQRKVLDDYRDLNVDYNDWHQPIIEGFEEELKENFGFDEVEVEYTGFFSQGDGASFTGKCEDSEKFMRDGLGITKSTDLIDMGEEKKSEDGDLVDLIGDLRNIGFDARERYSPDDFYFSVARISSRYSHENTIEGEVEVDEIEMEDDDDRDVNGMLQDLVDMTTKWAREKSKELYNSLYKYYEELQEDDVVKETILANDYKFDKRGNLL